MWIASPVGWSDIVCVIVDVSCSCVDLLCDSDALGVQLLQLNS
jgi:hypothetical protein